MNVKERVCPFGMFLVWGSNIVKENNKFLGTPIRGIIHRPWNVRPRTAR